MRLMHLFNNNRGYAWPCQATLATDTGYSVRNVQLALHELRDAGYIQIKVSRGRGNANAYYPALPRKQQLERGNMPANEHVAASSGFPVKNAKLASPKHEPECTPYPLGDTFNSSTFTGAVNELAALEQDNRLQPGEGGGKEKEAFRQLAIDLRLSEAWLERYFDPVRFDEQRQRIYPPTLADAALLVQALGKIFMPRGWLVIFPKQTPSRHLADATGGSG